MTWEMVRLGDLMLSRGGSINPAHFPDERFDLYSIPSHDLGGHETTAGSNIGSSKQIVLPGDVMLSKIVPHIRRTRVVDPSSGNRQVASGEWIIFRGDSFDSRYLRAVLLGDSFHARFMNTVAGVGGSLMRARPQFVAAIEIPLPPLEEQRRIAAILDEADEIRTKRRAQLALLDELPQSLFHEMFGDSESETVTLSSLAEVSSGITKGRRTNEAVSSVPYLAVANVQAGSLQLENVKQIEATQREITRYALQPGDVVMTEGGDPDKLGRGTLWSGEIEPCLHQNHIFRVRFPTNGKIRPAYFAAILQRAETRRYFLRSAKKTTGIASINMSQLKALPVPVPSLEKQQSYLAKVEAIQAERSRITTALKTDDELFAALQYRAFRGEL